MSRTIKGKKPWGFDFWSRRPASGSGYGKDAKQMTKERERMADKELICNIFKNPVLQKETEDGRD